MSPTPSSDPANDTDGQHSLTLTRRRLLGTGAAVGAAALAGCNGTFVRVESTTTTVERRFDAADLAALRVTGATDDVSVARTDGDSVLVRADKRAHGETELSELRVRTEVAGGTLRVGTDEPTVVGIGGGSVALEIEVPGTLAVERVRTDDGDIALRDTSGDTVVETGDGDVTVEGVDGAVTARSDDGDVSVERVGAVREVSSGDGSVTAAVSAVDGSASIRSGDGDVVVRLAEDLDAAVELTTGDGEVTVAGLDGIDTSTGSRVVATLGDGSGDLGVHSDDGDVTATGL
jgi:hypothetical protein